MYTGHAYTGMTHIGIYSRSESVSDAWLASTSACNLMVVYCVLHSHDHGGQDVQGVRMVHARDHASQVRHSAVGSEPRGVVQNLVATVAMATALRSPKLPKPA